jgi:hypothetical protein
MPSPAQTEDFPNELEPKTISSLHLLIFANVISCRVAIFQLGSLKMPFVDASVTETSLLIS